MQKLNLKDGLLYTSISIVHDGKKVVVDDVIVNTKLSMMSYNIRYKTVTYS